MDRNELMKNTLWQKSSAKPGRDDEVMTFMAGEDVILDRELLPFDIQASQAHVNGLIEAGMLNAEEGARLVSSLQELAADVAQGHFEIDSRFEDGHSAIEAWLTDRLGETGRKVHAGRSRNDQVAVALRLWLKDRMSTLATISAEIASVCLERAAREAELPMPGYTHLQRAMPSSVGLWLAGHAECFIDNAQLAQLTAQWFDASPLGTASGFGVNLPLARDTVATELGFARQVVNPQCAQNSRGKVEIQALSALSAATRDLRRLAWDLSLFCTSEFDFVRLPESYCTGSSIMPNKNNPDAIELLRAVHPVITAAGLELESVLSLPSGYQRDLQATKPPLLRAFKTGLKALKLVPPLIGGLEWNTGAMSAAVTPDMHATDYANELAQQGMPFRDAYRRAAEELDSLAARSAEDSIRKRVSPGACGNLQLDVLAERLDTICDGIEPNSMADPASTAG
jgi:argininosuccinate lyase